MYFPNAFRKSFLAATTLVDGDPVVDLVTAGSTNELSAGQLGAFNPSTYTALASATAAPFIIASGSYFTKDKISPALGGYQESVKSKVINPKYISRVFTVASQTPVNQVVDVDVCNVVCDKTYRLRIDVKGSPTLRFLTHNLYRVVDAYTGCCGADGEVVAVDPTVVAVQWAQQLNRIPYTNSFVTAEVIDWDGNVIDPADYATYSASTGFGSNSAKLRLTVAYIETKFGNCTFTPTDFYDLQPLKIIASFYDDAGQPCNVQCFSAYETQAPRQATGVGETVVRNLILDGRYRQEHFPDSSRVESLRMREIEANPVIGAINRTNGFYDEVNVLHSVPRFNNPSGTFDNDQYLLTFYVPAGTDTTPLTEFILNAAAAASNAVVLEQY